MRIINRRWRKKNKNYFKQYYATHKDQMKENTKRWLEKNGKKYYSKWYQRYKEMMNKACREYYYRNREKILKKHKEYRRKKML